MKILILGIIVVALFFVQSLIEIKKRVKLIKENIALKKELLKTLTELNNLKEQELSTFCVSKAEKCNGINDY